MKSEVWANEFGDTAIFVGDMYVIYDKVDRLEAELSCVYKTANPVNIEQLKKKYYDNGFRPVGDNTGLNSKCTVCKYNNICNKNVIKGVCSDKEFRLTHIKDYEGDS